MSVCKLHTDIRFSTLDAGRSTSGRGHALNYSETAHHRVQPVGTHPDEHLASSPAAASTTAARQTNFAFPSRSTPDDPH